MPSRTRCHHVNIWCACASKASPTSEAPLRPRIDSKSRSKCAQPADAISWVPVVGTVAVRHQDTTNVSPTAREPRGPHGTCGPQPPSPSSSLRPIPGSFATLAPAGLIEVRHCLGVHVGPASSLAQRPRPRWLAPLTDRPHTHGPPTIVHPCWVVRLDKRYDPVYNATVACPGDHRSHWEHRVGAWCAMHRAARPTPY